MTRIIRRLIPRSVAMFGVFASSGASLIDQHPASRKVKSGRIPQDQYPTAPTIVVDYTDDIGTQDRRAGRWTGPIPGPYALSEFPSVSGGGGCSFHIECDDGNPCSTDTCNIDAGMPAGSGTCVNTPVLDGQPGDCIDDLFCNGTEACQGGICVSPSDPCIGGQVCSEGFNTCQAGACTTAADCTDNDLCTSEICNAGVCERGAPPCGLGADCTPKQCALCGPGCNGSLCLDNTDCFGGICNPTNPPTTGCSNGRCCIDLTCTKATKANCVGDWYASDNGGLLPQDICPPCPLYEGGIGDDPFTAIVGPASLSPANNLMSGTPIRKIGDDYNFCASGPYLSLTNMRFVGSVRHQDNSRVSFEFYDADGTFIEDIFFITLVNDLSVQNVAFLTGLVIPCEGFIVAHVLQNFANDINAPGEFHWVSTDGMANPGDTLDQGTNNKTVLYIDSDLDWSSASPPQPVPNFIKVCVGGLDAGTPCGTNSDCESGVCQSRSTDVLAFELEGLVVTDPPRGACCPEIGGVTCDEQVEWECEAAGGTYLGLSTKCATCSGGSNPGVPCRTCTGGDNAGLPCGAQSDCPNGSCDLENTQCLDGGTCLLNATCSSGACCVTLTGDCQTAHTPSSCATADGEFQGYGTDCYPDCCEQPIPEYTGADNCEDTTFILFNPGECALAPDGTPCAVSRGVCRSGATGKECYVTITGDNSPASSTPSEPDSCYPPPTQIGEEFGWFEGFSTSDCAFVRIDYCCTDPVKIPSNRIIYDSCPCGQPVFARRDPYLPDEPPDARGLPYCDEDNAWQKFGPLPADHYYIPILSFLGAQFGRYQLHLSVKPCQDAACCYNACSNSSNATGCSVFDDSGCPAGEQCVNNSNNSGTICKKVCDVNAECGTGNTCDPHCGLMNQLECQDIFGAFLAPPNRATPVTVCGTICNSGSCCTGPGQCDDDDLGTPMSDADCDLLGGEYVGGFRCYGGTCTGGSRDGLSCAALSQCTGGGTACTGTLTQPFPCPVCEIAGPDNCQPFDDSVGSRVSDLTVVGGMRAADDFRPEGVSISQVCVWGIYTKPNPNNPGISENCGDEVSDNFQVVIYHSDVHGLPGPVFGFSHAGAARYNYGQIGLCDASFCPDYYIFQLTLDSPITGLDSSGATTYWLEVRNDTTLPNWNSCVWSWSEVAIFANDYSAVGGGVALASYGPNSARTGDMAFCLSTDFEPGLEIERACCTCNEVCTVETKRDCDAFEASWDVTSTTCTKCPPLPSDADFCADALAGPITPDGSYEWDNHCATTDGPNPTPTELSAGEIMANDLWYKYVATSNGDVVFSTCPSGSATGGGVDSMIAAYRDPNNPTVCSCPTQANHIQLLFPNGTAYDENCNGFPSGSAYVTGPVNADDCLMVRVGGFGGQGGDTGIGILVAETVVCACGEDPPIPGDLCVGGVNNNLACSSAANCFGGVCGSNKSRYISITPAFPTVAGGTTSIQVEIVSAKQCAGGANAGRGCETNAQCPASTCVNSPQIGDISWAGPEISIPNSPQAALRGSLLQCSATPVNAQVWTAGTLFLYGPPIVPFATYNVRTCDADGAFCSDPLLVGTGEWGDVVAPFGGASQPAFGDINEVVFKFRNLGLSQPMPRVDLVGVGNAGQPNTPNLSANFADIGACVEGFRGLGYPYTVPVCNP